jgi:hypothetical protein
MQRRAALQQAQALVEVAIGMSVLVLLLAGLVAVSVVTAAELGLVSVAEAAAHSAALAASPDDAVLRGQARGLEVGRGYQLGNGSLAVQIDASAFRQGGQVQAGASYTFRPGDFFFGLSSLTLSRSHVEPIARYRGLP